MSKTAQIKQEMNEIIAAHIPEVYNDGDVRVIPRPAYERAVALLSKVKDLSFAHEAVWYGTHGKLILVPSEVPSEEKE